MGRILVDTADISLRSKAHLKRIGIKEIKGLPNWLPRATKDMLKRWRYFLLKNRVHPRCANEICKYIEAINA